MSAASSEDVNLVTAGGNYGWPGAEGVCGSQIDQSHLHLSPRQRRGHHVGATFGPDYLNKVFIASLLVPGGSRS
ncbi:MAG: hypothetical protein ACXWD3_06055 [Mycobacterium sp.]